jgi:transposase
VADAGLLSTDNIKALEQNEYEYILGARPKNETNKIKEQLLETKLENDTYKVIKKDRKTRLIFTYSDKRQPKMSITAKRGLQRLEKQIKSGKLTKSQINNKGYNKYLKMEGDVAIKINYEKYNDDKKWDGIKAYLTNTTLNPKKITESYKQLWHIEKAFRMSKTDLKIRPPVYHRLARRIEAHICISFPAYKILKALERVLKKKPHSQLQKRQR